jgi:hypothetical protein
VCGQVNINSTDESRAFESRDTLSTETLQGLLRGEASIHVAQIDHHLQLDPNRLLKLSWLASELAAKLEGG